MIRYRLLGPLEAPAQLPGGKPRALLARFLLDAGRVVPVETLVESLWDEAPASAHKVLQVYVSQLRKALGPAQIETNTWVQGWLDDGFFVNWPDNTNTIDQT